MFVPLRGGPMNGGRYEIVGGDHVLTARTILLPVEGGGHAEYIIERVNGEIVYAQFRGIK
jgi:hypothetical protein